MALSVFPAATTTSGDPASQTFGATAAGTYLLSTSLTAGMYEIATDTVQSSFVLVFQDSNGIQYSGTIRGGKGYVMVPSTVTKIVIPFGLTYPTNINIILGAYTMASAPSASITNGVGDTATFTYTPPAGATDIIAYFIDGTNVAFGLSASPKEVTSFPGARNGLFNRAVLVAKDANGNIGTGVSLTSNVVAAIPLSGGTLTSDATYYYRTFLSNGTLTGAESLTVDVLRIAGGGGGTAPGGGAGGLLYSSAQVLTGTKTIVIGSGGATGATGNDTTFTGLTASAGGGASYSGAGGSGGGAGGGATGVLVPGGAAFPAGQGNTGGSSTSQAHPNQWTGGGGGAGGSGGAGGGGVNGDGGNGVNTYSSWATATSTGVSGYYAGGGGGRKHYGYYGAGGSGGAGGGGAAGVSGGGVAGAGTANTGGGGGGADASAGAAGGSGIVIVRYTKAQVD